MESAIQKYALSLPCPKFGPSQEIGINNVLGGLLAALEFAPERQLVEKDPQFVLGDFSVEDLRHLYDTELVAYEVWRTAAQRGARAGVILL